jgi:hypothetical protein
MSPIWILQGFDRRTTLEVEAIDLGALTDDDAIRRLLGVERDEDVTGGFNVTRAAARELEQIIGQPLRADLDYQVRLFAGFAGFAPSPHLWVLTGFERDPGDSLVEEFDLPNLTDDDVRQMFSFPADDDLIGEIPVVPAAVEELERLIGQSFRRDLEYFLGAVQSSQPHAAHQTMTAVHWAAFGFDKKTEKLIFEIELHGMDLEKFRKIFGLPDDDPVHGASFPVKREHVPKLQEHAQQKIDFDSATWFAESYSG